MNKKQKIHFLIGIIIIVLVELIPTVLIGTILYCVFESFFILWLWWCFAVWIMWESIAAKIRKRSK